MKMPWAFFVALLTGFAVWPEITSEKQKEESSTDSAQEKKP